MKKTTNPIAHVKAAKAHAVQKLVRTESLKNLCTEFNNKLHVNLKGRQDGICGAPKCDNLVGKIDCVQLNPCCHYLCSQCMIKLCIQRQLTDDTRRGSSCMACPCCKTIIRSHKFCPRKKNEYIDSEGICHHSYDKYLDPVRYSMFDEERWKDQNENSTCQSQVHEALFQVSFKSNSNEVLPCFHKSHHIFAAKNNNIVDAKSMENLEILFQKRFYKWLVERVKTEKFTHFAKVTSIARKQKGKTMSSVNFLNFVGNLDDRLLMRCFTALATGYLFSELRYLSLHNPNLERDILRPFVMTEVCLKWLHDRSGKNKSPAIMQEILADQLTAMGIPVNVMTVLCKLSIVSHPNTVANKIKKCATSRLLEDIKVRENTAFAAIFDNIGFVKKKW